MKKFSFAKFNNNRKTLLKSYFDIDHIYFFNKSNVLLSSPHGVEQRRNGKIKYSEPGSLATMLWLFENCKTNAIAKTKYNFDDANFDENSAYKDDLQKIILQNKIKYILDFHGLARNREMDVNLGTNCGNNIKANLKCFYDLISLLEKSKFIVTIDVPFKASGNTISNFSKTINNNIFSLQIEINSKLTNDYRYREKLILLLSTLKKWIDELK